MLLDGIRIENVEHLSLVAQMRLRSVAVRLLCKPPLFESWGEHLPAKMPRICVIRLLKYFILLFTGYIYRASKNLESDVEEKQQALSESCTRAV